MAEAPAAGIYQLLNKATANHLPEWNLSKLESKTSGAVAGDVLGSAALFIGAAALTKSASRSLAFGNVAELSLTKQALISGLETGTAGAAIGFIQPVAAGKDFWTEKGKVTAHNAISFAAMGATSTAFGASGYFGKLGERSLGQAVLVNSLAGGTAGIVDAYARAGIMEGRLANSKEVINSTLAFSALGGVAGGAEFAAPYAMSSMKSAWQNLSRFKAADALSTERALMPNLSMAATVEKPGVALLDKPLSTRVDTPLPKFDSFEKVTYAPNTAITPEALAQSNHYIEKGLVAEPFKDGVRLSTTTTSEGLNSSGFPVSFRERFVVIDPAKDPVLRSVLNDAKERFAQIKEPEVLAGQLTEYSGKLLNRYNLDAPSLETLYESMLLKSSGPFIPLGEFVRSGSGVCLQRAALLKFLSDGMSLPVRLREGLMGIKRPQPHVWAELGLGTSSPLKVYDPMHAPNPAYRYLTPKGE